MPDPTPLGIVHRTQLVDEGVQKALEAFGQDVKDEELTGVVMIGYRRRGGKICWQLGGMVSKVEMLGLIENLKYNLLNDTDPLVLESPAS